MKNTNAIKAPVRYDATRHTQQSDGKWRDNVAKRFVSIEKESIPAELRDRAPVTDLQGVELPEVPPQPAPAQAQPAQAQPAQPAPQAQPAQQAPSPPRASFAFDSLEDVGEQAGEAGAALANEGLPHEHIEGCYKGHAEGRMCACGVRVYQRVSKEEATGNAHMMVSVINRFSPNPMPLEPNGPEEAAWINAFQEISVRYGSPWAAWAPHLAVLGAVLPSVLMRRGTPGRAGPSAAEEGAPEAKKEVRADTAPRPQVQRVEEVAR